MTELSSVGVTPYHNTQQRKKAFRRQCLGGVMLALTLTCALDVLGLTEAMTRTPDRGLVVGLFALLCLGAMGTYLVANNSWLIGCVLITLAIVTPVQSSIDAAMKMQDVESALQSAQSTSREQQRRIADLQFRVRQLESHVGLDSDEQEAHVTLTKITF